MTDCMTTFLARATQAGDKPALVEAGNMEAGDMEAGDPGRSTSYADLLARVEVLAGRLCETGIGPGSVVLLLGDFDAPSVAWLLALWKAGAVVAPVLPSDPARSAGFADIAQADWIVEAAADRVAPGPGGPGHPLVHRLGAQAAPGLIIFTSGTTGQPKAALHDLRHLLRKFETPGKDMTTLAFLLFDHIAGVDTLLYCLANGATIVCPGSRAAPHIMGLIETHRVEVLPTAPSFLNLLVLSGAAEGRDLSSLKIVTYGAEMMPQPLLERLATLLPGVRLIQKYGTSEAGAPRSRSPDNTSRWLDLGAEERDWRIREGCLELPGGTAMLGYLNAPSPFTDDGWYRTGDKVERDGALIRILGRASDIINVGGEKVFPAEIEAVICQLDGVAEAAVAGRPHPIMGSVVCAKIRMDDPNIPVPEVRARIRRLLVARLEPFKIPQKIEITSQKLTTARFKQAR